jgi:hypothetical protein
MSKAKEYAKIQKAYQDKMREAEEEKAKLEEFKNDEAVQKLQDLQKTIDELFESGDLTKEELAEMFGLKVSKPRDPKTYIHPVSHAIYSSSGWGVTAMGKRIQLVVDKIFPGKELKGSHILQVGQNEKGEWIAIDQKVAGKTVNYKAELEKVLAHFKDPKNKKDADEVTKLTADAKLERVDEVEGEETNQDA